MSFLANPDKNARAQEASGIRADFFWILFFVRTKKSISPAGARTGIKITVALATPYTPLTLTLSHKGRGDGTGFRQAAQVPLACRT
jgi:hypothetical protein